ncbi:MAG: hypothetical protein GYA46_09390 [candidate division Zixibacteria bacterium]|nr:hypothetical protein [candidate division Zixibacteria bacterium]
MVLRRIGPFSCAKVSAVLYLIIGLIVGAIFSLISLMVSSIGGDSEISGMMGMLFGVGSIIFFPIIYAIAGFIGGLIMAALYNLVAGMVGGIELDLEPSPQKPPQP